MNTKRHEYSACIKWTGNTGEGTAKYNSYKRSWQLATSGKPLVECSNDPVLGGDPAKHNPEDMLVASIASCHMLWYLHLCAVAGITVTSYKDIPLAIGEMETSGAGRFKSITLRPQIVITATSNIEKARAIHNDVHQYCFIARSINFPVEIEPGIVRV
ncbi:MAG: OsmC family protein [Hyphomicrobiales bacterium]|nr:OsmC family protein [Hyphomicrobiales bacterium]